LVANFTSSSTESDVVTDDQVRRLREAIAFGKEEREIGLCADDDRTRTLIGRLRLLDKEYRSAGGVSNLSCD
jgi:hypothetical protein